MKINISTIAIIRHSRVFARDFLKLSMFFYGRLSYSLWFGSTYLIVLYVVTLVSLYYPNGGSSYWQITIMFYKKTGKIKMDRGMVRELLPYDHLTTLSKLIIWLILGVSACHCTTFLLKWMRDEIRKLLIWGLNPLKRFSVLLGCISILL